MDWEVLLADIEREQKRASKATYLETKRELAETILPLLAEVVEAANERLTEVEETLGALIEDDSVIQPELADQVYGTLELGAHICAAVKELPLDDVTKTRLYALVEAYLQAKQLTEESLAEVVLDPEEDDEDDSEDEEDEEDGDDEEGSSEDAKG